MLPVYLLPAVGSNVATLDDAQVDSDLGVAFQARLKTLDVEVTRWATLRRFVQHFFISGTAGVAVVPVVDGSEGAMPSVVPTFDVSVNGTKVVLEVPFNEHGTRFGFVVVVTDHQGRTQLGEWERVIVPRRTSRAL